MLRSLYKIRILADTYNAPFAINDEIIIYYNDVSGNFEVTKNGSPITSGPELVGPFVASYIPEYSLISTYWRSIEPADDPAFQYCSLSTLVKFTSSSIFPYAEKVLIPNSPECSTEYVCDIFFNGPPSKVKPTNTTTTDGSITISAISSLGTVKYGFEDVDYASMPNTTGVFTGLTVGTYTIYAKDPNGCTVVLTVVLTAIENYFPKYRLEWKDLNGVSSRLDILEKDFAGSVEEVVGGGEPFVVRMRGENQGIFNDVLASEASVQLTSTTNLKFLNLFTESETKYQVIFYKGDGLPMMWKGFITPSLYTEDYYTDINYQVTVEAIDRLALLTDADFTDSSGNKITGDMKLIKIISLILEKTKINLPIRVACNLYEQDMDQDDEDDPLDQTFINVEKTYYDKDGAPMKCREVLLNILRSFGARLVQWGGYWNIVRIDEHTNSYDYRIFDATGDYISNGFYNPLIDLKGAVYNNRAVWRDRSAKLEVLGSYADAIIKHKLVKKELYLSNGGFEDVLLPSSFPGTIQGYKHWSLILNGNIASFPFIYNESALSSIKGNNSNYCAVVISNSNSGSWGQDAYLLSKAEEIIFTKDDGLKFSFDFFPISSSGTKVAQYVKFKISLRVENYYLQSSGLWSTDPAKEWIEVIVGQSDFNKWNTIEITANCPPVSGTVIDTFQTKVMPGSLIVGLGQGGVWYFNSLSGLKGLATISLPAGYITWVYYNDGTFTHIRWYKLRVGIDGEDSPKILRPDDYNGTTNKVVWENIETESLTSFATLEDLVDGKVNKFDNIKIELLPGGIPSPDEKDYITNNTTENNNHYTDELINGDVPPEIANAKNQYLNFYKFEDGTPTRFWKRDNISELQPLLSLLSKQVIEQYLKPKFKLSGSLFSDVTLGFLNSFSDGTRKFIPSFMELADKSCNNQVELLELTEVSSTITSPFDDGEFDNNEFGQDFDI